MTIEVALVVITGLKGLEELFREKNEKCELESIKLRPRITQLKMKFISTLSAMAVSGKIKYFSI